DLERVEIACILANVLQPELFEASQRGDGLLAVCRYRSKALAADATLDRDRLVVRLREPAQVVSPGQLLVLYDAAGDEVVASGIIEA
ncbi:MAG: aminomethyltransferase beta-barrel domain-containing protein, partial [Candidatus Eremiobacterales bacterium]